MPYLISYSYRPLRKTTDGFWRGEVEHAMVPTTESPAAFVLNTMRKSLELQNGTAADWHADDIQALLSVVEIDDDEYVALNEEL